MNSEQPLPTSFIWRRVHSLLGLGLVLFIVEHLFINAQAALPIKTEEHPFARAVNIIHGIPYLHITELLLIGTPLFFHMIWGIKRIFTARGNALRLPYGRNIAYSWQRISSWILLIGIIAHVIQMRILDYPIKVSIERQDRFLITLPNDSTLIRQALQMNALLYRPGEEPLELVSMGTDPKQLLAAAPDFGTATLLTVRKTFINKWMRIAYTLFVLAASFHALNGVWTFLLTWGVVLSYAAQKNVGKVTLVSMFLLALLGLFAVWGIHK